MTPFDMGNSALIDNPEAIAQNTLYSDVLRDVLLSLYTPGIDTFVLDVFEIIADIQAGSPENGFEFLTGFTPCDPDCTARTREEQDSYVFLDFVHLTTATNSIIAGEAADLLMNGRPVAPIPLPAAGWLLIAGLGGLGALRLRAVRRG